MYDVLSFRIDRSYEELKGFVDEVGKVCDRFIVYQHSEPDIKVHIHGYMEKCTVSTDTLKIWVKKALHLKAFPKTEWAFPEKISKGPKKGQPVDIESLMYFHKGKYPILYNKGFTQQEIDEQHSKSYTPQEYVGKSVKTQYKLVCENPSQKKHRENDLIQMMIDRIDKEKKHHAEDVFRIINDVLCETKTICGVYKAVDYYDVICCRMFKNSWVDSCMKIIQKRNRM